MDGATNNISHRVVILIVGVMSIDFFFGLPLSAVDAQASSLESSTVSITTNLIITSLSYYLEHCLFTPFNYQKQFGLTSTNGKLLRVVPLFETLTDLNNAADVCETLFSLPGYLSAINGKQEIMVSHLSPNKAKHSISIV